MKKSTSRRSYIHPEGWRFAAIFFSASVLLLMLSKILAMIGFILTAFVIWFFRDAKEVIILWDPERESKLSWSDLSQYTYTAIP